jgi:hypothetical protein
MARSLHESFDTAYKGSLKAARRTALRAADRATVAEALAAMVEDEEPTRPAIDLDDCKWWIPTGVWLCACSGHDEVDPVTHEPMDSVERWGRCVRKGGGWLYRNVITGEESTRH